MATRRKPTAVAPPPALVATTQLPTVRCLAEYHGEHYALYNADAVDLERQLPTASIHFNVHSPPFSNLYAYSDYLADMGNSLDDRQFFRQYGYLIREQYRTMMPGRIVAVHCKDLVDYRGRDGRSGLRDFPGDIVRAYESCLHECGGCGSVGEPGPFCAECGGRITLNYMGGKTELGHGVPKGFKLHSKVVIWKCPVLERARTNAHGLLYRQLRADSSFSRQGLMEYVLAFRRWPADEGEQSVAAATPITHTETSFSLPEWQQIASPVWVVTEPGPAADENERELLTLALAPFGEDAVRAGLAALATRTPALGIPRKDINVTDVLNVEMAASNRRDEGHMCPLQLPIVDRCVRLWSNPGEIVRSPFAGIGSEGVGALRARTRDDLGRLRPAPRLFIGSELKPEYAELAAANLRAAEPGAAGEQSTLFDV